MDHMLYRHKAASEQTNKNIGNLVGTAKLENGPRPRVLIFQTEAKKKSWCFRYNTAKKYRVDRSEFFLLHY